LVSPLLALAMAGGCYLALHTWNYWLALAVAILVYGLALVYADGRQLMAFIHVIVRPAAVKAEAA